MTPPPLWPTPTPLAPATPPVPIELNFELGQEWAYSAVQFWNTADQSGGGIELVQFALITVIVMFGLFRVISALRRL
jgi:hypothetical protein